MDVIFNISMIISWKWFLLYSLHKIIFSSKKYWKLRDCDVIVTWIWYAYVQAYLNSFWKITKILKVIWICWYAYVLTYLNSFWKITKILEITWICWYAYGLAYLNSFWKITKILKVTWLWRVCNKMQLITVSLTFTNAHYLL